MQESRETLFRLQRMAGFESQNFDPQVALLYFCIILQLPQQNNVSKFADDCKCIVKQCTWIAGKYLCLAIYL